MRKLITLKKDKNIPFSKKTISFLDPESIYIPLPKDILIDNEISNVLINQIIYKDSKYIYTSSVSGTITEVQNMKLDNKEVPCIKINNNYKEKKQKQSKYSVKDLNDLKAILLELHLDYLWNKINIKKCKNIILNCIEDEPYVYTKSIYLSKYADQILDTVDFLKKIVSSENAIIALKNIDQDNIESFVAISGTYANIKIKILEDKYLLGRDYFLTEYLKLDLNETIVLTPEEVFAIYNAIIFNRKTDTKYVTFVDYINNKCKIANIKLYTSLKDILSALKMPVSENTMYVKNSLFSGIEVDENEIITENDSAFYILKREEIVETNCINCGKCYQICPVRVNPKYAMDKKKKNKHCIDCGLCSYICPANINLRKFLKGDKDA